MSNVKDVKHKCYIWFTMMTPNDQVVMLTIHAHVAHVTEPLYRLLKKCRKFKWNQEHAVVKKTVHKRNRRTGAWEPVLHARTL